MRGQSCHDFSARHISGVEAELPLADTVVGLGGGTALDMAKYVAWRRGIEPVLVPTIASVDACVTNTIATRDEGKVRYIGFIVPQTVLANFDLLQSASLRLNRAGVGDILSIHTALWDWQAAAAQLFLDKYRVRPEFRRRDHNARPDTNRPRSQPGHERASLHGDSDLYAHAADCGSHGV